MITAAIRLDKLANGGFVESVQVNQTFPRCHREGRLQSRLRRGNHLSRVRRHDPFERGNRLRTRLVTPVMDDHAAVFKIVDLLLPRNRNPMHPPARKPRNMRTGCRGDGIIRGMR